jgi:alpha-D-ribose 1-methylphosphonate 5-triphosphate synthase subunit PhnL
MNKNNILKLLASSSLNFTIHLMQTSYTEVETHTQFHVLHPKELLTVTSYSSQAHLTVMSNGIPHMAQFLRLVPSLYCVY